MLSRARRVGIWRCTGNNHIHVPGNTQDVAGALPVSDLPTRFSNSGPHRATCRMHAPDLDSIAPIIQVKP
jgi:hypothetical protein